MNPLKQTAILGQSIWLDFISRQVLDSGELHRLVETDGLGGVTSNPSIFEKSIREGSEYAAALSDMRRRRPGATAFELYEALVIKDIQDACDVMRPVYDRTKSRDGYVSLEVTMHRGETPEEIVRLSKIVMDTVRKQHPEAPIFLIAVTPSPSRFEHWPKISKANQSLEKLAMSEKGTFFVSTQSKYLNEQGEPMTELFVKDMLHQNKAGYAIWSSILKDALNKNLK